jgi:hypothetical protein
MIDKKYGLTAAEVGMTNADVITLREFAHTLHGTPREITEILVSEFGVPADTVVKVLDGEVEPYIGGPLRALPLQGCNPDHAESTRNRQRFVRGVLLEAMIALAPEEFAVFSNFNGMTVNEAEKHVERCTENKSTMLRFRDIMRRHADGQTIEQAVSTHAKKLRANAG